MFNHENKVLVYMGSDHAGFKAKEEMKAYIKAKSGYGLTDLGCFSEDPCDYPDIAREVGEKVLENGMGALGIIICGSGIGVSIAANKLHGIRAVLANDENLAEMARMHNDANVLTMGARHTDLETMKRIVDKFFATKFSGEERHIRRVEKLNAM